MWDSERNEGFRVKMKPKARCGSFLSFAIYVTSGKFASSYMKGSLFQVVVRIR